MTVRQVVHDLTNRPASGAVRRIQLISAQALDGRAQLRRNGFQLRDQRCALARAQVRAGTFKRTDGILKIRRWHDGNCLVISS